MAVKRIAVESVMVSLAPRSLSSNPADRKQILAPQAGFEPATPGLGNLCSILLSYWGTVCNSMRGRKLCETANPASSASFPRGSD